MVFASTARINSLVDELEHKLLVMASNTDADFSNDIRKLHEIKEHVQKVDFKMEKKGK